jgi:hypothetical protein
VLHRSPGSSHRSSIAVPRILFFRRIVAASMLLLFVFRRFQILPNSIGFLSITNLRCFSIYAAPICMFRCSPSCACLQCQLAIPPLPLPSAMQLCRCAVPNFRYDVLRFHVRSLSFQLPHCFQFSFRIISYIFRPYLLRSSHLM